MDLIIDLDSLLYKAGFSVEKRIRHVLKDGAEIANFQYAKDLKTFLKEREDAEELVVEEEHVVDSEESAIKLLDILLAQIKDNIKHDNCTLYLGGADNFRYQLYPDYKASRKDMPRPTHLAALEYHATCYGAEVPVGYEADDATAMHAWRCIRNGQDYVIAGIDKDLKQIPGWHYNYGDLESKPYFIDPYEADFNFYTQLLMGDNSDNIPGLNGIGIKIAQKLLVECLDERDMYKICTDQWREVSGLEDWEEQMVVSAQLLYLLREEGDKWSPPV